MRRGAAAAAAGAVAAAVAVGVVALAAVVVVTEWVQVALLVWHCYRRGSVSWLTPECRQSLFPVSAFRMPGCFSGTWL